MALIEMEKGGEYILKTFNGTRVPNSDCEERENYWKLIEERGRIVNFAEELGFSNTNRVLFQFKCDVKSRGLECHNEKPNALWILKTDLSEISQKKAT